LDRRLNSTMSMSKVIKEKVAGSLYGLLVGDAVAVPGHWYYLPSKLRADYGEITGMVAPKKHHPESMVQGMSYSGTVNILHDKAHLYSGHNLKKDSNAASMTKEEEAERRDDHGNYVGKKESERIHYHQSLEKGQNTANACIARLAMRYIGSANSGCEDRYHPEEYLDCLYNYMTSTPPKDSAKIKDQLVAHNDTYLDVYLRGFFTKASEGKALRDCAMSQRDVWSIGSIDGVAMCVPIIAAYSYEPEWYIIGRAIEHAHLTHKSVTVTAVISVLAPLLRELYHTPTLATSEDTAEALRGALDRAMSKMSPPKVTGRELRDSYVNSNGPGGIPKPAKWKQHMDLDTTVTTKQLVHKMIDDDMNDEDVAGWSERPESRLSTACYCEHTFTVALYLAYKYAGDPTAALLRNVMIGGHSTSRGAVLGSILGAAYGSGGIPFKEDLAAEESIGKEIADLVSTIT